jgi:NNP family nitrate/nitrite transporter-like MFS transporter
MSIRSAQAPAQGGDWLPAWEPENEGFWARTARTRAWVTLIITTASLTMAFSTWFLVSALVVRLPAIGFGLTQNQLYWLAAMPGLAGGLMRLVHMFLVPIYGTRKVVSLATASLLLPLVGWGFAVQSTSTPYWVLLGLAFLAGLGGGNFSSFMPSTSLFFPKRLQGTALAIQAGIGNFGVSIVQFVTPWIIGLALFGSLAGGPQAAVSGGSLWVQNAAFVYVPIVAILAILAFALLRSVPVRANIREQLDIFGSQHTYWMTILYIATFGTFSGLAATFPLLIRSEFGGFEGAPDPLAYAFLGPLVGSAMRVVAGPFSDRFGGAKVTQIACLGLVACTIGLCFFVSPESMASFPGFVAFMLGIFFFAGIGNASTFKQIPMLFQPRQAGGVIGWTAAIAAFGPFFVGLFIGYSYAATGSPRAFFYWAAGFFAVSAVINWWCYARRGAANPC